MCHIYYSRRQQCSANCTYLEQPSTYRHTYWYIVHETLTININTTHIQVHASPATDITLSFHIHWFSQFVVTHFATIICCVSQLWEVWSGVNVVVWINEAFGRRNDLQGIRTRLLHHEWYNSSTRYAFRHFARLILIMIR